MVGVVVALDVPVLVPVDVTLVVVVSVVVAVLEPVDVSVVVVVGVVVAVLVPVDVSVFVGVEEAVVVGVVTSQLRKPPPIHASVIALNVAAVAAQSV